MATKGEEKSARQASKNETREALLRAGAAEFVEKGLDGASLNGICARAGYTRGAFYVHFHDRDERLVAIVDRMLTETREAIISTEDASRDLATTVGRYVAAVLAGAPGTRGVGRWQFHHTLTACAEVPVLRERYSELQRTAIDRLVTTARAGQRAGAIRADVSANAIGELLVVLTMGVSAMLDAGVPFDLQGGAAALVKMLAGESGAPRRRSTRRRRA